MLTMNLAYNPSNASQSPKTSLSDGYCVSDLLEEVRNFALMAFDQLNSNQDDFVSREELEAFLEQESLTSYQRGCAKFLLTNIEKINQNTDCAHDGISREDISNFFASSAKRASTCVVHNHTKTE